MASRSSNAFHRSELRIKQDHLLKQRVQLEKSLNDLKMDLAALQTKNRVLDKCVTEAKVQMMMKESEIKLILAGNADSAMLSGEIEELVKIRKRLSMEVNGLNLQLDQDLVQLAEPR